MLTVAGVDCACRLCLVVGCAWDVGRRHQSRRVVLFLGAVLSVDRPGASVHACVYVGDDAMGVACDIPRRSFVRSFLRLFVIRLMLFYQPCCLWAVLRAVVLVIVRALP